MTAIADAEAPAGPDDGVGRVCYGRSVGAFHRHRLQTQQTSLPARPLGLPQTNDCEDRLKRRSYFFTLYFDANSLYLCAN